MLSWTEHSRKRLQFSGSPSKRFKLMLVSSFNFDKLFELSDLLEILVLVFETGQ